MAEEQQSGGGNPFRPYQGRFPDQARLPRQGRSAEELYAELGAMAAEEDAKWTQGQVSGTFYHGGEAHRAFLNRVFSLFSHVNVLQSDLCPSMAKLEGEVIAMTADLLHAAAARALDPADQVCGSLTSGGSESILMAMKSYREWSRAERGIAEPEIVIPATAHPAFLKAGQYFGIKMVKVPVQAPDFRVDPAMVEALVNRNTAALVGSAGNYPYGLIDPISALSDIAIKHGVGLHVDGCLGGFILPWFERLGRPIPTFDFRLRGVTSISADTHKYGYGLKGTSVVLYRNRKLRRHQYFQAPDWAGGLYASPTAAGSRSGGLVASTWASMVSLGEEGYLREARAILEVADAIQAGVKSIPELVLIGEPTFLIAFRSDQVDVFHVNDYMLERGWRFNCLQLPPGLHFCVTLPQTRVPGLAARFTEQLRLAVEYARERQGTPARSSALYGLAGTAEGNAAAADLLTGYLELLSDL